MTGTQDKAGAVVFDLGNVIVSFDHRIACRRLANHYGLNEEAVYRAIFSGGQERQFDSGKLSPEEFTDVCSKTLGVKLQGDFFKQCWTEIFWANDEVIDLIEVLHHHARLILLSNTNVWHFEYIQERFDVLKLFDHLVLSFKSGYCKPDVRIFEEAMTAARGCSPIVYVDDIAEYVQEAVELGFAGITFNGAGDLRRRLAELDLLETF